MSYTRYKIANLGASHAGLTTVGYALDGDTGWTAASERLSPTGKATGVYHAVVTFPDDYAGTLMWTTDTGEPTGTKYAPEEINPGTDEYLDAAVSGVPVAIGARAFTRRNQDSVTSPTVDDALFGAWHGAFGAETESDSGHSHVKLDTNGTTPVRSFTLTEDGSGNPIGRA